MIRDNYPVLHMPPYTSTINCGYLVDSPQTSFGATITKFQLTIPTSGKLCGAKFKVKL